MILYKQCFKLLHTNLRNGYLINTRRYSNINSSKYKTNVASLNCLIWNSNYFHTTPFVSKRRKTAEERKSVRIIEYSPKAKGEFVNVWHDMTVKELATALDKDIHFVRDLFLNQVRDANTVISDIKALQQAIKRAGRRMNVIGKPTDKLEENIDKDVYPRPPPTKDQLKPRPPVVTVMGHVDHGKTTLLDALRHASVVEQEFGGITQHIGAFSVVLDSGAKITFLDTPGHAAFSAMRARGANLTDIVVLVVAADDGVMEQTVESIRMARQANVPILVAINKIDAPKADVAKTEKMLIEVGIQVENLGGDVQAIPISALKRRNLEQLTEALVLQAEFLEVSADPTGPVEAIVVESKVDQNRGKLCTVVVQRGTLRRGNILVAGTAMAKVRNLKDEGGKILQSVGPGYPVEIEGWKDLPSAGDQVLQVDTEKRAKEAISYREFKQTLKKQEEEIKIIEEKAEQHNREYKEQLQTKRKLGRFKVRRVGPRKPEIAPDDDTTPSLNVVIKGDVDGTLEALLDTFDTYESDKCKMDLVHYGVGAVTQNEVEIAALFKSIIYAFNVDCPPNVKALAEQSNVDIRHFNVIYKLIDDVKNEINSRLPSVELEEILGEAQVLQQFEITHNKKKVNVAGCKCVSGSLRRSAMYKVIRNDKVLFTGNLSSMRHLKDEVDSIKLDMECGLQLTENISFEKGDRIICFEKKFVPQFTDWDPGF